MKRFRQTVTGALVTGVLVTGVLAACTTIGDADRQVIDTRTGEPPVCKGFAGVVEDTVREDRDEVTRGLQNLARDLQALARIAHHRGIHGVEFVVICIW